MGLVICQLFHIYTGILLFRHILPKAVIDFCFFWPTVAVVLSMLAINVFVTYTDDKVREIEEEIDSKDKHQNVLFAILILLVACGINFAGAILWMHNTP